MAIVNRIVSVGYFYDEFKRMGRGSQFSYEGLGALYDYLEEVYDGFSYELDVIGLCCEYNEAADADDFLKDYGDDSDFAVKWKDIKRELAEENWDGDEGFPEDDEEQWYFDQSEAEEKFREVVEQYTSVIPIGDGPGFIYVAF